MLHRGSLHSPCRDLVRAKSASSNAFSEGRASWQTRFHSSIRPAAIAVHAARDYSPCFQRPANHRAIQKSSEARPGPSARMAIASAAQGR